MSNNDNIVGIDKMIEQFKSESELKAYCNVQFKQILKLKKDMQIKEDEIVHLKDLLSKSTPILQQTEEGVISEVSHSEQISTMQLKRLRDVSMQRELTLEESKKVEIFTKIVMQLQKKSVDENEIEKMSPEDLLKLVNTETPNTNG